MGTNNIIGAGAGALAGVTDIHLSLPLTILLNVASVSATLKDRENLLLSLPCNGFLVMIDCSLFVCNV